MHQNSPITRICISRVDGSGRAARSGTSWPRMVGLMTQLGTVCSPIRLKSSDQTFSDTKNVCQKTCVTWVISWDMSRAGRHNDLMTLFRGISPTVANAGTLLRCVATEARSNWGQLVRRLRLPVSLHRGDVPPEIRQTLGATEKRGEVR